jgi:hypothetical protein
MRVVGSVIQFITVQLVRSSFLSPENGSFFQPHVSIQRYAGKFCFTINQKMKLYELPDTLRNMVSVPLELSQKFWLSFKEEILC